jgi:hypothetical protein
MFGWAPSRRTKLCAKIWWSSMTSTRMGGAVFRSDTALIADISSRDPTKPSFNAGFELTAAQLDHHPNGAVDGNRPTVDTVARQRVKDVGDGRDTRFGGYLLSLQTSGIAASVPPLVVAKGDPGGILVSSPCSDSARERRSIVSASLSIEGPGPTFSRSASTPELALSLRPIET